MGAIGAGVPRFLSFGVFEEGGGDWLPSGVVENGEFSPLDTGRIAEEVLELLEDIAWGRAGAEHMASLDARVGIESPHEIHPAQRRINRPWRHASRTRTGRR